MTFDGILLGLLALSVPALWAVSGVLIHAAIEQPRIRFLTSTAVAVVLISVIISMYIVAVVNTYMGMPLPQEFVRTAFRLILLAIAFYPFVWMWLFLTGRFGDGIRRDR